jgi:hypothetical protein
VRPLTVLTMLTMISNLAFGAVSRREHNGDFVGVSQTRDCTESNKLPSLIFDATRPPAGSAPASQRSITPYSAALSVFLETRRARRLDKGDPLSRLSCNFLPAERAKMAQWQLAGRCSSE